MSSFNSWELSQITTDLLTIAKRAEAVGAFGTALMIVAAARQAEQDRGGSAGAADRALVELLSLEPDEPAAPYDLNGG